MAMITLNYDAHNASMRKAIDLLLSMGATPVETNRAEKDMQEIAMPVVVSKKKRMTRVEMSMKEAREGKVKHFKTVDEMFQSLGI